MSAKRPRLTHNGNGFIDLTISPPKNKVPKRETPGTPDLGKLKVHDISETFVDKYKPKSSNEIIGQSNGDRSNVSKLKKWLENWYVNREADKSSTKVKKSFGADDGSSFKAVLLSGPPGIGKTTTAQLVCQEVGYTYKELNASDTRSKKSLTEEVSDLLENMVLDGYFTKNPFQMAKKSEKEIGSMKKKHVVIMDEVDGMAGNEDRGGIAELIKLIKETKSPIICICNDRTNQKIRSLTNYCYDLRFYKPRVDDMKRALERIASKEGLPIDSAALDQIIASSNQDIRQSINYLNMAAAKKVKVMKTFSNAPMKDVHLGPFEAIKEVFPPTTGFSKKIPNFRERCDLFFHDYNLMPLMVFENYLKAKQPATRTMNDQFKAAARTADSLAFGDIVEKTIRSTNNWSFLPLQAVFSVGIPATIMDASMQAMPMFPTFLGRLSNMNKRDRLLQSLKAHMNLKISGTKSALSLDYLDSLRNGIMEPLSKGDVEGTVEFLDSYYLRKEDLDAILELSLFSGDKDPYSKIDTKTKTALTRAINKSEELLPYSRGDVDYTVKKTKSNKKSSQSSKSKKSQVEFTAIDEKKGKSSKKEKKSSDDEDVEVQDEEVVDVPDYDW